MLYCAAVLTDGTCLTAADVAIVDLVNGVYPSLGTALAAAPGNYSVFKTALAAAGMSGLLGGNNFTALVPSDEVWGGEGEERCHRDSSAQ
jgi:hypothetical protein